MVNSTIAFLGIAVILYYVVSEKDFKDMRLISSQEASSRRSGIYERRNMNPKFPFGDPFAPQQKFGYKL